MATLSAIRKQAIRERQSAGETIASLANAYKTSTTLIEGILSEGGVNTKVGQDEHLTIDGETKSLYDWAVWWIGRWKPSAQRQPSLGIVRKTIIQFRHRARRHSWERAIMTGPDFVKVEPNNNPGRKKRARSLGEIRTILYRDPWPRDGLPCAAFVSRLGQSLGI